MRGASGEELETSTIVVRLAEAAAEWRFREVKPALGAWCDGYITKPIRYQALLDTVKRYLTP